MGTINITNHTVGIGAVLTGAVITGASFMPKTMTAFTQVPQTALFVGGVGVAAAGAAFALFIFIPRFEK